ncbi:MAG: hypothetical protein AMXMBFR82_03890 [Candidatus Hydrogenedentota bacterium]
MERAVLTALGVITGGLFSFYCFAVELWLAGNPLDDYEPSFPVERFEKALVGQSVETFLYLPWLSALCLLLVLLPRSVLGRCKWVVAGMFISQFVASRAFAFMLQYFINQDDSLLRVTFAEIRQEMTALERWIYTPLVDLLERGWGYWAIALHSIVLGAFWTLVIYGVYRLIWGMVQRRRSPERAPEQAA